MLGTDHRNLRVDRARSSGQLCQWSLESRQCTGPGVVLSRHPRVVVGLAPLRCCSQTLQRLCLAFTRSQLDPPLVQLTVLTAVYGVVKMH